MSFTFEDFSKIACLTAKQFGIDEDNFMASLKKNFADDSIQKKKKRTYTIEFLKSYKHLHPECHPQLKNELFEYPEISSSVYKPAAFFKCFGSLEGDKNKDLGTSVIGNEGERDWRTRTEITSKFHKQHKTDTTSSEHALKLKTIKSNINKLSPSNQEKLTSNVIEALNPDPNSELIQETVTAIFSRGTYERPEARYIHANFCVNMIANFSSFKNQIFDYCQLQFEPTLSEDDDDEDISKFVAKRSGLISFLSELLKVKIITPKVIKMSIEMLEDAINLKCISESPRLRDINLCHICELIDIVIVVIKSVNVKKQFEEPVKKLKDILSKNGCSTRLQLRINDTLELSKKYLF